MPAEIRIYFEGDKRLKPGFAAFFAELKKRATENRCRWELIATGGKPERDFAIALKKHPSAWNILLRDSEGPCKPDQSHADSIFWMVQMMEAWFHADKDALAGYYGAGFRKGALKANPNVEEIPKQDLEDGLKAATKGTQKGPYHKVQHAPAILDHLNPALVRTAAPNCDKLFSAVLDSLR
jgi:hypothetical protein